RHVDGSWRILEAISNNLSDDPSIAGVVVNARDVTGRREAEEKLRKSEASLSEAQRMSNLGNWEWNVKSGEVSWSDEVYRIYGFAPWEVVPTLDKLMERVHPDDRELLRRAINGALYEGKTYDLEHRIVRPDGAERVVQCRAEVAFDEDGEPLRMVGTIHDITSRKRVEEALRESEERFRIAFENAPIGVALVGPDDMRYLRVNRALCEMLGYSEEELLEKTSPEVTHPGDHEISADLARRALGGEFESYSLERRYLHADGHLAWNLTSVSLIRDSRGEPSHFVCLHQDVTERKEAEEALRQSEERFRGAFEDAPIGVALVGLNRNHLRVNRAYCEMVGYSEEELLEKAHPEIVHPDDREISAKRLHQALEGEGPGSYTLERRYLHADGHALWVLTSISLIRDSRGEPSHLVCLHQDIDKRKVLEERLEHQVLHDPLTGLANRTLLMDRLEQALARLDRRDEPIAVLFADLDDFKLVNDSLGHEVGDLLLVEVAGRLKECVRPEDTVARLGGDEFVILLEGISDLSGARRVAERIVSSLEVPFCFEGHEVFMGASIGIAPAFEAPDETEDLLRNADLALYGA
ncbi:MAG TPA: PAS domain S-box protein, partial [Rubrobacter sp.]|nr:PAS domain S-box protein [Rubrobacter sp.]